MGNCRFEPLRRSRIPRRLLPLFALLGAQTANAQLNLPPLERTFQWYGFSGDHSAGGRWGIHLDGGFRLMADSQWRQWLVRPGVNYALSRRVQLSAAYAFFKSHPGGIGEDAGAFPEHRAHEQIAVSHRVGSINLRHRGRVEQRLIARAMRGIAPRIWNLQNRFRYMARTDFPLIRARDGELKVSLSVYDEVMLRIGGPAASGLDQNRLYLGFSFRPSPLAAIDVGVFNQRYRPAAGGGLENNLVFVTSFSTTATPWKKKL